MLRKTKILEGLRERCKDVTIKDIENGYEGISASEIADALSADRANTSKELNQLVKEKLAIKINGRPVYYFDKQRLEKLLNGNVEVYESDSLQDYLNAYKDTDFDFEQVIGNDGSLKEVIKKAKAAMIYPPFGIHTLLVGPTGVGKTMFAEIMYFFGKKNGILKSDSNFVVFNCAEYAENPQLLLGQLFGYEKGAYTGAEKTNEGLVAQADGGVLFLDEIHRLPPEGQEMLFMLLDRGEYRRLGSNSETQKVKVLVIAATTENVESSLLRTFIRRVPMTIPMPSLKEKKLRERFELIEKFFRQEYNQMQVPIYVNHKVMRALLSYECLGNVGQLKADIKLLCANAFLDYKTKNMNEMRITSKLLQDHIYRGLLDTKNKDKLENFMNKYQQDYFVYNEGTILQDFDQEDYDIYKFIDSKYEQCAKQGMNSQEANKEVKEFIEDYVISLSSELNENENEGLYKIVPINIYHAAEVALRIAAQRLQVTYSKKVLSALTLHLLAIVEKVRSEHEIKQSAYDVVKEHPNEYETAKGMRDFLEKELEIILKDQELIFLTMFLYVDNENVLDQSKVALLALAHGDGVARNMIDVANALLHTNHGHALDMSLHQSANEFLEVVIRKVEEIDEGKGVLLMADMGSLLSFDELISKRCNISVKSINLTSTPFLLEALRKTMMPQFNLVDIYGELNEYQPYLRPNKMRLNKSLKNNYAIITTCMSGEGAAVKLGQFIESAIPFIHEKGIEIISCNANTFKDKDITNKKILAVVGALDLALEEVPYLSSDKIILEQGLQTLNEIIAKEVGESASNVIPNLLVNNFLQESLVFLDPVKANNCIRKSFEIISRIHEINDYNRILIGYMMHVGCMIERCLRKEDMVYIGYEKRLGKDEKLCHAVKTGLKIIEDEFQVNVSDTEVSYVMDIFDTE